MIALGSITLQVKRVLSFSALHFALSPLSCNIHIDEFGVVLSTADGSVSLSPNALHHIGNELILKTIIKEFLFHKIKLPRAFIDHLYFLGPNATNGFRKIGGGFELNPTQSIKINAGFSCSILDNDSCRVDAGLLINF